MKFDGEEEGAKKAEEIGGIRAVRAAVEATKAGSKATEDGAAVRSESIERLTSQQHASPSRRDQIIGVHSPLCYAKQRPDRTFEGIGARKY